MASPQDMPPRKDLMLTYDLSKRGKTPTYLYLYQCIRDDIMNGVIAPEEKIPSKRALATHLGTSVITVENAYNLLLVEGYVRSRERVGFFAEDLGTRAQVRHRRQRVIALGADEHVYFADFSSNKVQTALYPSSSMAKLTREMLSLNDPNLLRTVPFNGIPLVRHAISEHLARYRGMDVDPDQIIVGSGIEYLYSRLMQLFDERTVLGLEDPGNHKFSRIAARNRIRSEFIPIDSDGVQLDRLAQSGVSLMHVSPANSFPLGSGMPIRRRLDLLSWLDQDSSRYLIEDDFDSELNSYGNPTTPIFAADPGERTIYLNSFSKTLVPSLRISYMVLPPALIERYLATMTFYSCTVSGSDQYVLARFIQEGYFERHLNHLNTVFKHERAQVVHEMHETGLDELGSVFVPPAGTHVIVRLGDMGATRAQLKRRAEKLDIRFAFVADYASEPTEEMHRELVVNYASVPPERLREGLLRLKDCIAPESGGSAHT